MTSPSVAQTLLLTEDNIANLDPATVERWKAQYEGTVLGRQELYGELLDDADGALWSRGLTSATGPRIEMRASSSPSTPPSRPRLTATRRASSWSARASTARATSWRTAAGITAPLQWARQAIDAYNVWGADLIVAESNNGGEMVRVTLNTVDSRVPVQLVHASKGKFARAEPVKAQYEQDRWCSTSSRCPTWRTRCATGRPRDGTRSPDRIDALVWALTDLMLDDPWAGYSGSSIA